MFVTSNWYNNFKTLKINSFTCYKDGFTIRRSKNNVKYTLKAVVNSFYFCDCLTKTKVVQFLISVVEYSLMNIQKNEENKESNTCNS